MLFDDSIAFLGPAGTYSNEAALRFAARLGIAEPHLVECTSFDEVFDCVDDGVTRFGVVGKENSLEGPVTATLDNFAFRTDAVILAEEVINVSHCLVAHPEADLDAIVRVASHPQGIAQCRRFLATELPGRTTLAVSSTAVWPRPTPPVQAFPTPWPPRSTGPGCCAAPSRTTRRTRPPSPWWAASPTPSC